MYDNFRNMGLKWKLIFSISFSLFITLLFYHRSPMYYYSDNIRYLLSALSQSLAAIFGLGFSITLIALQISASKYGYKIFDLFFDRFIISYLGVVLVAIFFPFYVLYSSSMNFEKYKVLTSIFLGAFVLSVLPIYFWDVKDKLNPLLIIQKIFKSYDRENLEEISEKIDEIAKKSIIEGEYDILEKYFENIKQIYDSETVENKIKITINAFVFFNEALINDREEVAKLILKNIHTYLENLENEYKISMKKNVHHRQIVSLIERAWDVSVSKKWYDFATHFFIFINEILDEERTADALYKKMKSYSTDRKERDEIFETMVGYRFSLKKESWEISPTFGIKEILMRMR
ncbi:MAG: DUF2254 family protein [Methanosarcinales archaeon]